MIIYNVTIKLEEAIHEPWLNWMKSEHIPDVINTGCFTKATMLRLLEIDDSDGPTYAIQYFADSKEHYDRYIEKFSTAMRQKLAARFGNGFVAFRSVMQAVN